MQILNPDLIIEFLKSLNTLSLASLFSYIASMTKSESVGVFSTPTTLFILASAVDFILL